MSFRRYEVILPTRYNDGAPVEPEKFQVTYEEVISEFGAVTWQPETLKGIWTHAGQRFEEANVRFFVDVAEMPRTKLFRTAQNVAKATLSAD
jgi:hypothetical protein